MLHLHPPKVIFRACQSPSQAVRVARAPIPREGHCLIACPSRIAASHEGFENLWEPGWSDRQHGLDTVGAKSFPQDRLAPPTKDGERHACRSGMANLYLGCAPSVSHAKTDPQGATSRHRNPLSS